jgi:hypothetical protein
VDWKGGRDELKVDSGKFKGFGTNVVAIPVISGTPCSMFFVSGDSKGS